MKNDYQKYLETQSRDLNDWEDIANQSLKEKTIDSLKKKFDENLEKKILYTRNDINLEINNAYARGLKEEVNEYLPWHICSIIDPSNDSKLHNSRILNELERGASSIEINHINDQESDEILKNIDISIAPIFYRDISNPLEGSSKFLNLINNWKNKNEKDPLGGLEIDSIAISFSKFKNDNEFNYAELINSLCKIIKENKNLNFNLISFDGEIWNSLGASLNEEIALMCLSFLEMLKRNIIDDESLINFTVSLDTDFFLNIAKIRSLRIIINNLYDHFGINPNFKINGRTAGEIIFKESPWVNQLRITNAALSAAIANVDKLTCHHITNPLGQAPEFVRRLTRNTHIILQEESNIGKIQDAAGGSYYIENITKSIADKSFDFVKSIERKGGILSLLENKDFINTLSENKIKKDKMLEEKSIKRIGVNLYPDKEIREINIKPYEKIEEL
tara:strand:+ start:3516 stop:4859 length:1344 start_codon:yes stop_codon:yes gene_type:complete